MKRAEKNSGSMARHFVRNYLLVSMVPILCFLVFALFWVLLAKASVLERIETSIDELSKDAENHLEHLGKESIRVKASGVAAQTAFYLKNHPGTPLHELLNDPEFKRMALQQVGETGYTCLYEAKTGIMRLHPDTRLIDRKMDFLAGELPSWWSVFEPSLAGKQSSGYYDWLEPDGTVRRKYMTVIPVPEIHMGRTLLVAATTYIDEFSAPLQAMRRKADIITESYRVNASKRVFRAGAFIAGFLVLAVFVVYLSGRRAALRYILPIERLAGAAKRLGRGEWEEEPDGEALSRKDEIGVLAREFTGMQNQLKGLFRDLEKRLHELREAQNALQKGAEHFRSLFDGVPVGLYRTTPEGEIIGANLTLARMLGCRGTEELLARNATEFYVNPGDRLDQENLAEKNGASHRSEYQLKRLDGSIFWVEDEVLVVKDAAGLPIYYEGSLKDITETKQAEAELRRSEERYRTLYRETKRAEEVYRSLLKSSPDAIVIYDMEGRTQFISPAFTSLFGWTLEELEGKRIPFVPDSERKTTMSIIETLFQHGTPCQGYVTKRFAKDGSILDVSISASRYDDHEGKPAGILVIIRNISERKRLEAQLLSAQKLEAIGTLAGGIAHDFNNMMMGVLGNVSLLLYQTHEDDPTYETLKSIENMIRSASRLTDQLLGYARKGRYEIKSLDINPLVAESAGTFGRTRREIEIELDLDPSQLAVEADRSQIEQVLMNLYINAADAMPRGGTLTVRTRRATSPGFEEEGYSVKSDDYVLVQVRDSGTGMDEGTIARIFDPFFTTKEMGQGTGLGLASVYGIVKGHRGHIDVESEKGKGSVFSIYLPLSSKAAAVSDSSAEPLTSGKGLILLIDDEETLLEVGGKMLEHLGYDVVGANGGREALHVFSSRNAEFDLIVLDMIMPDMGGGEVFDRLREMNPEVKVLLSSGYSVDGQASDILKRGCNGFIQKPFDLVELSRKISEIVGNGTRNPGSSDPLRNLS